MSWQETADRIMGVCTRTFTREVTYYPANGSPEKLIKGIFNEPYIEGILLDGAPFQTKLYRLGVRLTDLDFQPKVNDKVDIDGCKYNVHEIRPDGDAGAVLLLHKIP